MIRKRLSSRDREKLWDRVCQEQNREIPLCNICESEVRGKRWEESHWPVPRSFGGTITGIAHVLCNRRHGAKVVTPLLAKSNRTRQRHIGAYRPQRPLPGGREDTIRKRMDGRVVPR